MNDARRPDAVDLRIVGALIVDGTGSAARKGSLGIRGGRITRLEFAEGAGPLPNQPNQDDLAAETIDASGLVLAPGFIDIHSHGDLVLAWPEERREALISGRLAQGITTEIVGNCGLGAAPLFGEAEPLLQAINGWMAPERYAWSWESLGEYFAHLEASGIPVNVGSLVAHGPLRLGAMGLTQGESTGIAREKMRAALKESLEEGAFGLSAGLIYPPGMYTSTDELKDLATTVAEFDGLVSSHIRGSSETLIPAVEELIEIGEETGARVHHSHAEAVGRSHWKKLDQFLDIEDRARSRGIRLTADMFPYPVAATMMLAIYPPWSLEGGVAELLKRLAALKTRSRIRQDVETLSSSWPSWTPGGWPHNLVMAVGWDRILIASVGSQANRDVEGLSLAELGVLRGQQPFDAISDLMIEESGNVGQFVLDISGEEGLETLIAREDIAFITDANDFGKGKPHPAAYGSFPRVLGHYVRERSLLSLEQAIRRMTSLPAEIMGIRQRGRIKEGYSADLVLFDAQEIRDRATLDAPRERAEGIVSVYVNGERVFHRGRSTGNLPGQIIRR